MPTSPTMVDWWSGRRPDSIFSDLYKAAYFCLATVLALSLSRIDVYIIELFLRIASNDCFASIALFFGIVAAFSIGNALWYWRAMRGLLIEGDELKRFFDYVNEPTSEKRIFGPGAILKHRRRAMFWFYSVLLMGAIVVAVARGREVGSECSSSQPNQIGLSSFVDFGWFCLVFLFVSAPPFVIALFRLLASKISAR